MSPGRRLYLSVICICLKAAHIILCKQSFSSTFHPSNTEIVSLKVEFLKPFRGSAHFVVAFLLHMMQRYSRGMKYIKKNQRNDLPVHVIMIMAGANI